MHLADVAVHRKHQVVTVNVVPVVAQPVSNDSHFWINEVILSDEDPNMYTRRCSRVYILAYDSLDWNIS